MGMLVLRFRLNSAMLLWCAGYSCGPVAGAVASERAVPSYSDVAPILSKYCTGCHNPTDLEGGLSLESFEDLQQGVEDGPVVIPGQPESSRLVRVLTGQAEPAMPPEDYDTPHEEEIAVISAWIAAGAEGPTGGDAIRRLIVPQIKSQLSREAAPVTAIALSPDGSRVAVGRFASIDVLDSKSKQVLYSIADLPGKINAVHFSPAGERLIVATGVDGLYGRADVYDAVAGNMQQSVSGHRDILNDAELSPAGDILATGSYDRSIVLWDSQTGKKLRELPGHNGAVFDLAFSPDGSVLASASADETVKLWQVATGERLDTLGQPEGEQYAVEFSPDGRHIVAGGADNRIRIWRFSSHTNPGINPLLYTRFAHDGAVVALAFTADGDALISAGDDRVIKIWEASSFADAQRLPPQSSLLNDLSASGAGRQFAVGDMGGQWRIMGMPIIESAVESAAVQTPPSAATVGLPDTKPAELAVVTEAEPNDSTAEATALVIPGVAHGVVHPNRPDQTTDRDAYRFTAKAGEALVFEIKAARSASPLDSMLEILTPDGEKIEQVVLQAVRDSYLKYRGQDSDELNDFRLHNWEEMEINEFVYLNGEVMRLFFYPRGVDSGYMMYPGVDKRYAYFGTTAITHALNEPAYTVVPYAPGAKLPPSGLPAFPVYYENDDDGQRALGADSRVDFVAPRDGDYVAVVSDVRGFGGPAYKYELTARRPRPDFEVEVKLDDVKINPGSGREFIIKVNRIDGFAGEVHVDVEKLPPGFYATTPVIVEAGQIYAYGVVNAERDACAPTSEAAAAVRIRSSAVIAGSRRIKEATRLESLQLGEPPKVQVAVLPPGGGDPSWKPGMPLELEIAPGESISAMVRIDRAGDFKGDVLLGKDLAGRNLPHGVYIAEVGLNGLLILDGENQREITITAAKWVEETTRSFHLRAELPGDNEASWPVKLRVRRPPDEVPVASHGRLSSAP
jgi:hypothetical protein